MQVKPELIDILSDLKGNRIELAIAADKISKLIKKEEESVHAVDDSDLMEFEELPSQREDQIITQQFCLNLVKTVIQELKAKD